MLKCLVYGKFDETVLRLLVSRYGKEWHFYFIETPNNFNDAMADAQNPLSPIEKAVILSDTEDAKRIYQLNSESGIPLEFLSVSQLEKSLNC